MATFLPICDICMTDDTKKPASTWCAECEESICNDCEQQHSRMKLTKNHKTISVEDYLKLPDSIADIKQECKVHNRKLEIYCLIHNEPCCLSCISWKHGTCQKLKPLIEVVEGVKSSAAFEDLEDRANDINELIGDLIKKKQDDKASFVFQKTGIISEVQKIRKAINNHLDKLTTDLLNKLDNEEKKQSKYIDSFIEKISEMRKNVVQIVYDLKQIRQHASDFQAFLGIHAWNKNIEVEENKWMSLQTDQMICTDIYIAISPLLMKFEKNVKELGNLEVKSYSAKKILLKKEKQGQVLVSVSNTVDTITLTHIRSFDTTDGSSRTISITGIDMFDDGRIVLADNRRFNNQLFMINHECRFIKTIPLEDQCFDVAVIEKNTVAITLVEKKKIVFVDVNSSTKQRSIYTRDRCYGIYYTGEQLVVCLDNLTIQLFDLTGNTLSILPIGERSLYCSVFNNKLYYTAQGGTVSCIYSIDLNGEIIWKFDCQKNERPNGITNDGSGNSFVACWGSNELMVVGQDGKNTRILLTDKNELVGPNAIHYNRKSKTLLICNVSGKCFLYRVKY